MPLSPLSLSMRRRAVAFALIALALLGAQALGLAHRVLHGAPAAQLLAQADGFGHASGDAVACPLYDQLTGAESVAAAQSSLTAAAPALVTTNPARPTLHAGAAPRHFFARAPPLLSAA